MTLGSLQQKLLLDYFRWTVVVTAVIIIGLGYALFLNVKIESIRTTGLLERKRVENELKVQQEFAAALRTSGEKYARIFPASRLAEVEQFLPATDDFPGLLLTVKNIAANAGLTMDSLSVSAAVAGASGGLIPPPPSGVQTQDVTVSISGLRGYQDVKQFVAQLESSRRLLDVTSISFGGGSEETAGQASRRIGLVFRTYSLPVSP